MKNSNIITLVFLSLLSTSIFVTYSKAADYFPLASGDKWVYHTSDGKELTIENAKDTQANSGTYCIQTTSIAGNKILDKYYSIQGNNIVSPKEIHYGQERLEFIFEPAEVVLKVPPFLGSSWLARNKLRNNEGSVYKTITTIRNAKVVSKETITVAAGSFPCYKIEITEQLGSKEIKDSFWYAENVGLIKESIGDGAFGFELIEYIKK